MSREPLLIWGAGAIGGVLGAYLQRAGHEVLLVDIVEDHVRAMNETGISIEGPVEEFVQPVKAALPGELGGRRFERIVLAVKSHDTPRALDMLVPHLADGGYVVSAQNGLNELVIAERIGRQNVVGCFVNYGADWHGPGRILYGNRAAVALGELDGTITPRLRELHSLFSIVEPQAVMTDNIWGYLWGKLAYGALLFATALTNDSMADSLARERHFPVFDQLGREVMALAASQEVSALGFNGFDPAAFSNGPLSEAARRSVADMAEHNRHTAKTHSGIWRDLAVRKRKTEVDAQVAPLCEIGREAGIATPALDRLVWLIHEVEEGRRAQSAETLDEMMPVCA